MEYTKSYSIYLVTPDPFPSALWGGLCDVTLCHHPPAVALASSPSPPTPFLLLAFGVRVYV